MPGTSVAVSRFDRSISTSGALPVFDVGVLGGPGASQAFVGVAFDLRIKHDDATGSDRMFAIAIGDVSIGGDEHSAVVGAMCASFSVGTCDGVGGPVVLEVGDDPGAELVPQDSDGHLSGGRCAVCASCVGVGAVGSGVLCCVGSKALGRSYTDVGGARDL